MKKGYFFAVSDKICPKCGRILLYTQTTCPDCGAFFTPATAPVRRPYSRGPLIPHLWLIVKILICLAVLVFLGWLAYRGIQSVVKDAYKHPHPTEPDAAVTNFFNALQQRDYQTCYNMLTAAQHAAVVIGKQGRDIYSMHFERIRMYLTTYAAGDFTSTMQVAPNGSKVIFPNDVVFTIELEASTGMDEQTHYGIKRIHEFPIDVAPEIGVEKYYRGVNRVIDNLDNLGADPESLDDPAEIIKRRDYENKHQRLNRLIESFKTAPQLDTRHALFEWILKEFPREPATRKFLEETVRNEKEVPHLRTLAREFLLRLAPR